MNKTYTPISLFSEVSKVLENCRISLKSITFYDFQLNSSVLEQVKLHLILCFQSTRLSCIHLNVIKEILMLFNDFFK